MKSKIKTCLENGSWKTNIAPSIKRDILETCDRIKEKISIRFFKNVSNLDEKYSSILIASSFELFPVINDKDYLEFEDLLLNIYLYKEVSVEYFDDWVRSDIARYFPVIFFDLPLVEKVWILRDESFAKDALIEHVNNSASFLSWYRED